MCGVKAFSFSSPGTIMIVFGLIKMIITEICSEFLLWMLRLTCLYFLFLCFRDPLRAHREHMRQMMRSFSEPYGGPVMPSIMDGRNYARDMSEHPSSSLALRGEHGVRTCNLKKKSTPSFQSRLVGLHVYQSVKK